MKTLHRDDLFAWSVFDEDRNIDFNSVLWRGPSGSIVVDPLPLSPHDQAHVTSLGKVDWIVVTNSDHIRATQELAHAWKAKVAAPLAESKAFGVTVDRWVDDGDELAPGLRVLTFAGSKTPGELALLLENSTLITGDLIRCHRGGELTLLPDGKLQDRTAAVASVRRLLDFPEIQAVIVGDGWPIFNQGAEALRLLLKRI